MIPVFIGWDSAEHAAWHVLAHSIIERCSEPVALTPVGNGTLPAWWTRPRGIHDSTNFSNARFAVPLLMDFRGWAIFLDCDMVCLDDLANLWKQRDDAYAVMVRKHNHVPRAGATKFLGQAQARYRRKNWSSLMLLNCAHPATRTLTERYVNTAAGIDLHGFAWAPDDCIGEISGSWNELILDGRAAGQASLAHFTEGGPWHGYVDCAYAEEWCEELDAMLADSNPRANLEWRRRMRSVSQSLEVALEFTRKE